MLFVETSRNFPGRFVFDHTTALPRSAFKTTAIGSLSVDRYKSNNLRSEMQWERMYSYEWIELAERVWVVVGGVNFMCNLCRFVFFLIFRSFFINAGPFLYGPERSRPSRTDPTPAPTLPWYRRQTELSPFLIPCTILPHPVSKSRSLFPLTSMPVTPSRMRCTRPHPYNNCEQYIPHETYICALLYIGSSWSRFALSLLSAPPSLSLTTYCNQHARNSWSETSDVRRCFLRFVRGEMWSGACPVHVNLLRICCSGSYLMSHVMV